MTINFLSVDASFDLKSAVNGIGLSPLIDGASTLFYSPLSSFHIYQIPTFVLRDERLATGDVDQYVVDLGGKQTLVV